MLEDQKYQTVNTKRLLNVIISSMRIVNSIFVEYKFNTYSISKSSTERFFKYDEYKARVTFLEISNPSFPLLVALQTPQSQISNQKIQTHFFKSAMTSVLFVIIFRFDTFAIQLINSFLSNNVASPVTLVLSFIMGFLWFLMGYFVTVHNDCTAATGFLNCSKFTKGHFS